MSGARPQFQICSQRRDGAAPTCKRVLTAAAAGARLWARQRPLTGRRVRTSTSWWSEPAPAAKPQTFSSTIRQTYRACPALRAPACTTTHSSESCAAGQGCRWPAGELSLGPTQPPPPPLTGAQAAVWRGAAGLLPPLRTGQQQSATEQQHEPGAPADVRPALCARDEREELHLHAQHGGKARLRRLRSL